jgi:hypothetical protein
LGRLRKSGPDYQNREDAECHNRNHDVFHARSSFLMVDPFLSPITG